MACLRNEAVEGRGGAVRCDEEGCEFRLIEAPGRRLVAATTPQADCVLQLRLRAGATEVFSDEWDIDINLPMYTRDYLQWQKARLIGYKIGDDLYHPNDVGIL